MSTVSKNVKMVFVGNIEYIIDDKNTLIRMVSIDGRTNAKIPHKFETGEKIESIGMQMCVGKFERITISDKITNITAGAFQRADVFEVVWSKGCKTIPEYCFRESALKTIRNIEDVEEIQKGAFSNCLEGDFRWPSKCKKIPYCFFESGITSISNIDDVEEVEEQAFAGSSLESIRWPSKCNIIPDKCFGHGYLKSPKLKSITNIDHVTSIGEYAFGFCEFTNFKWPSGCKEIKNDCFLCCKKLESITGLENVETIGIGAFNSTGLNELVWPDKCTKIPERCFWGSKLKTIKNIDHVREIEESAFESTQLEEIEWPSACSVLPNRCFCSSDIKTVYNTQAIKRAAPITAVTEDAFFNCGEVQMIPHKENAGSGNVEVECTLPAWLSDMAGKEGIDLSALLKETLESMVAKPGPSSYCYPEQMEKILKYLDETDTRLYIPGKAIEKLYRQFSEDCYSAEWMEVSNGLMMEFIAYLFN